MEFTLKPLAGADGDYVMKNPLKEFLRKTRVSDDN